MGAKNREKTRRWGETERRKRYARKDKSVMKSDSACNQKRLRAQGRSDIYAGTRNTNLRDTLYFLSDYAMLVSFFGLHDKPCKIAAGVRWLLVETAVVSLAFRWRVIVLMNMWLL